MSCPQMQCPDCKVPLHYNTRHLDKPNYCFKEIICLKCGKVIAYENIPERIEKRRIEKGIPKETDFWAEYGEKQKQSETTRLHPKISLEYEAHPKFEFQLRIDRYDNLPSVTFLDRFDVSPFTAFKIACRVFEATCHSYKQLINETERTKQSLSKGDKEK